MKQTSESIYEDKTKSIIIIDPQSQNKHSISSCSTTNISNSLDDVNNSQQKQRQEKAYLEQKQNHGHQQILSDKSSRIRCCSYPSDVSITKRDESSSFTIDFNNTEEKISSEMINNNNKNDNNKKDELMETKNSDYYANIIHTQTSYITNLVNSVLTIDKMECGKLEIINKPFEIRILLWEIANTFKPNLIVYIHISILYYIII